MTSETIREYLLGGLGEERVEFEAAMFEDEALSESVAVAEDDLIRDYLAGSLTGTDLLRFEQRLKALPALADRVRETREIVARLGAVSRPQAAKPVAVEIRPAAPRKRRSAPSVGWLVAAAAILVCLFLSWRLGQERDAIARLTSRASAIPSAAFLLNPNQTKGEGPDHTLAIPAGTEEVRLRFVGPAGDVSEFQAAIRDVSGSPQVWGGALGLSGANGTAVRLLEVVVPGKSLPHGDYFLTLTRGGRTAAEYYFRVDWIASSPKNGG